MFAGLLFAAFGAIGFYCFNAIVLKEREWKHADDVRDFVTKLSGLERTNEDFRQQLEMFKFVAPEMVTARLEDKSPAADAELDPLIQPVKTKPPKLAAAWTATKIEAPSLEEMIESAAMLERREDANSHGHIVAV